MAKNWALNQKFVKGSRSTLLDSSLDKVVIKWLVTNVENVCKLLSHPAIDIRTPNKGSVNFHDKDGLGYKFLEEIGQLDKINPQVASRMVSAFSRWKGYGKISQSLFVCECHD
ncbi:hypothetical protein QQ045_016359 [Rhodiola kirilowii]